MRCRAQSLAVRLSTDRVPDLELLLRAPTAHKSDIARMLALQRLKTERELGTCVPRLPWPKDCCTHWISGLEALRMALTHKRL